MKTLRWAIVASLVGAVYAGAAMAQTTVSSPVQQPTSIRQIGYHSDDYGYAVADTAPLPGGPKMTAPSPSNQPPAPPAVKVAEPPMGSAGCLSCEDTGCDPSGCGDEASQSDGPVRLFNGPGLECRRLEIRGFIDAGVTFNPDSPLNRSNAPVGYNDRSNELMLNQVYLTAERLTKIEDDCGVDVGYRADVLFGTDSRFPSTGPIGTDWDSTWNLGNRFYGVTVPQMYGDLAYNKLLLRAGHFLAPVGYEVVNADGNFFYSHTYSFLYAQPTTLTGGYATYKLSDRLLVNAGFDTGWNEFRSMNDKLNTFFGFNWTSPGGNVNVIEEIFVGNTQPAGIDSTRVLFNTVVNVKLGDKWRYALESNVAHDSNNGGTGPASWTGWSNYLLYDINDCWGFGLRYEYFEDLDGSVTPNAVTYGGVGAFLLPGGKYNDVSIGLNWKPNKNVTCRTEMRWDWAEQGPAGGIKPFDDNAKNSQVLWGNDIVIRF